MLIASSVCGAGDPPITAAAFTPDKTGVVIGSQAGFRLLSWPDLSDLRTLNTELENIHHASFSPDGERLLIVGGIPGESGTAELLNWPDGALVRRATIHTDVIYEASWAPNGQNFVTASADGFCKVVEAATGEVRTQFNGHSRAVLTAIFLDEDHCISGGVDQTIRVWKSTDGTLFRTLNNHTQTVNRLAMQPEMTGRSTDLLASISDDHTVRVWQPRIGRLVKFAKLSSEPQCCVWSGDQATLHIATRDGMIQNIDVATMKSTTTSTTDTTSAESIISNSGIHELLLDAQSKILFAAGRNRLQAIEVDGLTPVRPH